MIVSVLLWRQQTVLPECEWEAGDRNQPGNAFICFCHGKKFSLCNNTMSVITQVVTLVWKIAPLLLKMSNNICISVGGELCPLSPWGTPVNNPQCSTQLGQHLAYEDAQTQAEQMRNQITEQALTKWSLAVPLTNGARIPQEKNHLRTSHVITDCILTQLCKRHNSKPAFD